VRKVEKDVDEHVEQLGKIFSMGASHGQEDRCRQAMFSDDRPPPGVRFMYKDHKKLKNGEVFPPTRMVCNATEGPVHRASIMIDSLVRPIADDMEEEAGTEVRSTEEVKRKLLDVNKRVKKQGEEMEEEGFEEERELVFFSQDVVGLYPSIIAETAGDIIEEAIKESKVEYQNVEWEQLETYLAITLTNEEKEELEIVDVLPKKTKKGGRGITLNYMKTEKHKDGTKKWSYEGKRKATKEERRKMLARTIKKMIIKIMKNHLYQFNGKVYKQRKGGPIGLLLTGTISPIVMLKWDSLFLQKLLKLGLSPEDYFRYVDDQGVTTWTVPEGMIFKDGGIEYPKDEEILKKPADERTANVYKEIANTIMPMIVMEEDFPSRNENKRIPVLDLEVWVHDNKVSHTFYRKPMANKAVINASSALDKKVKLNILVEEGMRRMRNVSPKEEWEETERHIDEFQLDVKDAGYPKKFRDRIVDMVVGKHGKEMDSHRKWEGGKEEGRPCYRTGKEREQQKTAQKEEGKKEKESWYRKGGHTSILWVPATPNGELMENVRKELEKTKNPEKTKIRIVQRGGSATSSSMIRGNPYPKNHCGRRECPLCDQGGEEGSRGQCYRGGIGYVGRCNRCPEESRSKGDVEPNVKEAVYHGESSKTFYRRTIQHLDQYVRKKEKSWMWKHVEEDHEGIVTGDGKDDFTFKLLGTFKDPTTRLANEACRLARDERGEGDWIKGRLKVLNDKTEFYTAKDVRITTTQF
jgi:hypothetical protein